MARQLVQIGVAVGILGLITRTWLVEGIVDPAVVQSGSMAPALWGAHRQATCRDCGFRFACGEESLPRDMRAICPNCGAENQLEELPALSGDRLFIDRAAYGIRRPERWDVVVLDAPDDSSALCVKRIVGLPGETVEIRDGDIYVDGQSARRSLRQLLAMAIGVHDASCRPAAAERLRWQNEHAGSRWRKTAAGYEWQPDVDSEIQQNLDSGSDIDWLVYEHHQTIAGGQTADRAGPILDDLAYNQNESRELLPVPDVLLRCRVEGHAAGRLWLLANDGRKEFRVQIDSETGSGRLCSGADRPVEFSAGSQTLGREAELVLALADAQLRLMVNGKLLVDCSYDPRGLPCRPVARPLAIGSENLSLSVTDLKVLRDVYYLAAGNGNTGRARRLGEDEYWLLGDNSAVSLDSRNWPAAHAKLLIGKVLIHRKSP